MSSKIPPVSPVPSDHEGVRTGELDAPPIPADIDVRNLDEFMLNVERFMASELVAISSHEAIAAALFLWCRAWKQVPAASLPDDDRVIAAFARLSPTRFKKLRNQIMRGFVKCSDGRWYHTVLAETALAAFRYKQSFQRKREQDAERLRKWRESQGKTHLETHSETRFTTEGQAQEQEQLSEGANPESTSTSKVVKKHKSTRVGELCKRLREIGIDAAPHLPAWNTLLPRFSDDEIITVAESVKAKKPGERLHLHYLIPILTNPPATPVIASSSHGRIPTPINTTGNYSSHEYGEMRAL